MLRSTSFATGVSRLSSKAIWVLMGASFLAGMQAIAQTATATSRTIPSTAVGSSSAQTPVTFTITATGSLGTPQVLTQGAANLDFTLGTGSTCTGAATGNCVVNVIFKPKTAGWRLGAVNLTNSSGTVIATAYISGTGNGPLAILSPGLITTYAGSANACSPATGTCGDGGSATASSAAFVTPFAAAIDAAGNIYIADFGGQRVRKVTASTGILSTVAGTGTQCSPSTTICGENGQATSANLDVPGGVAIDGAGNLFITQRTGQRISKVSPAGIITTYAGNGTACSSATAACGDTGAATSANLATPSQLAVDGLGNLYIADQVDNRIRMVSASNGTITTVAGSGTACTAGNSCGDGASATASTAYLNSPTGVAVDAAGNLYIADEGSNRIRKVSSGNISTVAGTMNNDACSPTTATCGDGGAATSAFLKNPWSVAVDPAGDIYIAEATNYRVRKVTIATGNISTIAGSGNTCSGAATACGDGGVATSANFGSPRSVVLDGAGNLYIADYSTRHIRKLSAQGGINYPTATNAGTTDTTDGTQTTTLNNIGNQALTFVSQTSSNSNFQLGNPNTGGCSVSNGSHLNAGDSCLIGATFQPQTGQSGLVVGNILTTDNSLNVANTTQNAVLTGSTSGTAIVLDVAPEQATTADASVTLTYILGYGATLNTGAATITVNGSATGVGTPVCLYKASHANCTVPYTGISGLGGVGHYTISVTIAASSPYAQTTSTATLAIVAPPSPGLTAPRLNSIAPAGTPAATPVVQTRAASVATSSAQVLPSLVGLPLMPVITSNATVAGRLQ